MSLRSPLLRLTDVNGTDDSNAGRRRPVRLGLVGIGRWGRILSGHLERHGDLAAVCATGGQSGRDWAARNLRDARYFTDVDELLSVPLDAVVIASPRSTHESLAEAALDAGMHALVEKPLAASAPAAARLLQRAEQLRLVLAVDYTHVDDSSFEALRNRIDDVDSLELEWEKPGPASVDQVVHELYPHVMSMAVSIDPHVRIRQVRVAVYQDVARVDARLAGPSVTFDARVALGHVERVKRIVTGPSSDGRVLTWTDRKLEERRGSTVETIHDARDEPLARVVGAFVDAVAARVDGKPLRSDWPSAVVQERTPALLDGLISLVYRRSGPISDGPTGSRGAPSREGG